MSTPQSIGFNDPQPLNGNPGYPGVPTLPRNFGESDAAYRARLAAFQAPYMQAMQSKKMIQDTGASEEAMGRGYLKEQTDIASQRLNDLAALLAKQQDAQFNRDIPGLAESAQAQGFLQTSGFGNSLANRYKDLSAQTSEALATQALADRDLEIQGIGQIGQNRIGMDQSALQRQFSENDQTRSEALARELAKYGVSAPAKGPSTTDQLLQFGGPLLSGAAAIAPYAAKATYLCTKLKNLGLMTEEEVYEVHRAVFPAMRNHPVDWLMYNLMAPLFIALNPDYNWAALKPLLCERVLAEITNEAAFQAYKSVCMDLFAGKVLATVEA